MSSIPWRIALTMTLILSIISSAEPLGVEAQSDTATLTIHSRFCPPRYDATDIFETCHENVGMRGVEYTAWSLDADYTFADIPDENGAVVLTNLPPGTSFDRVST